MKATQKKPFEGVPIVHPIVPEGCDQSRAIRGVCGGGIHHPVRRLRSVCTAFKSGQREGTTVSAAVLQRGQRDVGAEVQARSSTKVKQGWVSYW